MSNTDRDSMLERWADGMERLEQYYEGIYGPPATPPSLPPITTRDAMLEAIADGMERAKRNINKKSSTYHSDSVAYEKTVPSGDVHYASIEQIGGRTLVWNQLVPDATITTSISISGSIVDGLVTISGTASNDGTVAWLQITNPKVINGHKYLLSFAPVSLTGFTYVDVRIRKGGSYTHTFGLTTTTPQRIITADSTDDGGVFWVINTFTAGNTYDEKFGLNIVDITLMYGSGNEPTTVAEFTAQFPASYYPYNAGTLLSAGVTEVVSKKADTTEIATYSIPAEVQALEGYGWSAGTAYNYVDFERKVFVQNVGSVDLSTLTWGYGPSVGWSATLNAKNPADDDTVFNGISATLTPVTRNAQATAFSGGTDAGMVSVSGGKVYVGTGDIGIVPSGTLYYELATPVEIDISAYLTDGNLISVESGGTLTFPNANGDDYRIPVPSSVTFVVGEP